MKEQKRSRKRETKTNTHKIVIRTWKSSLIILNYFNECKLSAKWRIQCGVACCLFGPVRYWCAISSCTELDRYTVEISHCKQICDIWQDKHRQNSFHILAPVALNFLAVPVSQTRVECASHFLCAVICVQGRTREWTIIWNSVFSANEQEILGECTTVG